MRTQSPPPAMNAHHPAAVPRTAAVALFAVLALALFNAGAAPTRAQAPAPPGSYVRAGTWTESSGAVAGHLWLEPAGIDRLPDGRIVTSDARLGRVEILAADGTAQVAFGRSGAAPLGSAGHVAADSARDRVYVADAHDGAVAVFDLTGNRVAAWGPVNAVGVAVAGDGRVYVSDANGDRVRVFDPAGVEGTAFGATGDGPGQLDGPAGLDVAPDGRIFVADRGNARIVVFKGDGTPADTIKLGGTPVTGEPLDVAVAGDEVWVATGAELARLDIRTGRVTARFDTAPATAVAAALGSGVWAAVTASGVGGSGAGGGTAVQAGIWTFRDRQASGEPTSKWSSPDLAVGLFDGLETLSFGADGKAYLVDVPPRVQRLSGIGLAEAQFAGLDAVDADADAAGNVVAADNANVVSWAADGTERWRTKLPAAGGNEHDVVAVNWDAAKGQAVVIDAGTAIAYRLDAAGKDAGSEALRGSSSRTAAWTDGAVAVDGTWFALDAGGGQVKGWDGNGTPVVGFDLPPSASRAARLDVLPDGTLLILGRDGWAHRLARDGAILAAWVVARPDLGASQPSDIAADAAGTVYVVDRSVDVVTAYAWDAAAPGVRPPNVKEGCQIVGDKTAAPGTVTLGDDVDITLTVSGACASSQLKADIAVILDQSMSTNAFHGVQRTVDALIDQIDPSTDQLVIQAGNGTRLTNNVQLLRRMLRRQQGGIATWSLRDAIDQTERELFSARGRRDAKKVVIYILASEGIPVDKDTQPWQIQYFRQAIERAGGQLKRRVDDAFGIWMGTAADGAKKIVGQSGQGERTLHELVTDDSHFIKSRSEKQLAVLYDQIVQRIKPTSLLRDLTIVDTLPDNMVYVPGSADPPAVVSGARLEWRLHDVPLTGAGVRFKVRPSQLGRWPTNALAFADYVDFSLKAGHLDFPVPQVDIVHLPTDTPTVEPTSTTAPTATPTRTPTPTATATPTPSDLYFPVTLAERCDPSQVRVDAVLLIDSSTSMDGAKIDAAKAAARSFIGLLSLPNDQVAIIAFNQQATLMTPLIADAAQAGAALDAIALSPGTRIDLGLALATDELRSPRHRASAVPLIVLVTDGRQDDQPELAEQAADAARLAGATIYAIGLGADVDGAFLTRIAGGTEHFLPAPTPEDLAAIYRQVAVKVRQCPVEGFWGRR